MQELPKTFKNHLYNELTILETDTTYKKIPIKLYDISHKFFNLSKGNELTELQNEIDSYLSNTYNKIK